MTIWKIPCNNLNFFGLFLEGDKKGYHLRTAVNFVHAYSELMFRILQSSSKSILNFSYYEQDLQLRWRSILIMKICFKGILSTKIVFFSYPKLLSFSVLTFIKWRLTPSYAAKDTIFWQKRPKTIVIGIIVLDDNIQIYSYGLLCEHVLSMRTV